MSSSINKVTLIGNLGDDPEHKQFGNGDKICTFSIATNSGWKDKVTQEWREVTQWHRVEVRSSNLVSLCERRLIKGMKIYLEGTLETRKWEDSSGKINYRTEVVLRPYKSELKVLQNGSTAQPTIIPVQTPASLSIKEDEIPF